MSHVFTEEGVDIYKHPENINETKGSLTIGDLHGNALKLLYFLLRHNIIALTGSDPKKTYQDFVDLYERSASLESDKQLGPLFKDINAWMDKNVKVINKEVLIRLIGDEFFDRGNNDYMTLKLLEQLTKGNVKFHITISNHSNVFIAAYEPTTNGSNFKTPEGMMKLYQVRSSVPLEGFVNKNLLPRDEFVRLVGEVYKPAVKVLDYELTDEGITLFTHAPVRFDTIKNLANYYDITYQDGTTEQLAHTINLINTKFSESMVLNRASNALQLPKNVRRFAEIDREISPLLDITWNRCANQEAANDVEARPEKNNQYNITYVHGHDSKYKSSLPHVINLDNKCGKVRPGEEFDKYTNDEKKEARQYAVLSSSAAVKTSVPVVFPNNSLADERSRLAGERSRRFVTIFTLAGFLTGAGIGLGIAASGALAVLGTGLLGAMAAAVVVGGALAVAGAIAGLVVAKVTKPEMVVSPAKANAPADVPNVSRGLAGLGPAVSESSANLSAGHSQEQRRNKQQQSFRKQNDSEPSSSPAPH